MATQSEPQNQDERERQSDESIKLTWQTPKLTDLNIRDTSEFGDFDPDEETLY